MRTSLSLYLLAGALLGGPAVATSTHTVEWYRHHAAERSTQLQECRNNPGELGGTPNCMNAEKADAIEETTKTDRLQLRPLTEKDWGPTPWRWDNPHRSK